jgi:hypothetical protein
MPSVSGGPRRRDCGGQNGAASYVGTPGASRRCRGSAEARDFPARSAAGKITRSGQLARSRQESRTQEGGQLRPLREASRDPAIGRVSLL